MDKEGDDDVLTTDQVTVEYKISRTALWRLNKQGILTPVEDGPLLTRAHTNHYRRSDIEKAAQIIAERRKNRGRKPKTSD